jgi:hypothetical protein
MGGYLVGIREEAWKILVGKSKCKSALGRLIVDGRIMLK